MSRREYTLSPQCAHEGCTERVYYRFTTRRDQKAEMDRLRRAGGWRCTRHTNPDRVLMPTSPVREHVLVNRELMWDSAKGPAPLGLFWCEEDCEYGSGFTFGPGFKAFSEDFPEGARLVITARVELPDPPEADATPVLPDPLAGRLAEQPDLMAALEASLGISPNVSPPAPTGDASAVGSDLSPVPGRAPLPEWRAEQHADHADDAAREDEGAWE